MIESANPFQNSQKQGKGWAPQLDGPLTIPSDKEIRRKGTSRPSNDLIAQECGTPPRVL